jgi:hypothetical protein
MPEKRTLYSLFLLMMLIAYWIFVWQMERIVITPDQLPLPFNIPPALANAAGIFAPRVLRHFIPIIVGWLLAREFSANLVYFLYDLPDRAAAKRFLLRLRDPRIGGSDSATVTEQDLEKQQQEKALLRVGGPGRVTIPTGQVALSEVNGRYLRILSSGTYGLDRYERIHSVLDLRPQERSDAGVRLHSREGLEVTAYLGIIFRVSKGSGFVSEQTPFPFDPDAVRRLAYAQSNLPYGQVSEWEDTAVAIVTSILRETVERYTLNQLLQEEQTEVGAHLNIRRDVERESRLKLLERGIELVLIRIGRFRFPDDVTAEYIEQWRSIQDNNLRHNLVEREAIAWQAMEVARAEAELELVRATAASIANARRQGYSGALNDVMAVRFIQTLERLAQQSGLETKLPDNLLPQLHNLQQQLQLTTENTLEPLINNDHDPALGAQESLD